MPYEFYLSINNFMRAHPKLLAVVRRADVAISGAVFISYPFFLIWCFNAKRQFFLKSLFIPLVCFSVLSVFRYLLKAPRPYEKWDIKPLINKNTTGRSFPSRHIFSIFMLAETYLYATTDAFALPFYVFGLLLAVCRVLLGVHFIVDVVCGMVVALFCGVLYYIL